MVFIPNKIDNFKWRRSVLYIPATNQRALEKAKSIHADTIVFDLEDSITYETRPQAYKNLETLFKSHAFNQTETIIRIANTDSDIDTAKNCKPDGLLIPKTNTKDDILKVARHTNLPLWAMIETPLALMNLKEICTTTDQLKCLVAGTNDLSKDTGSKNTREIQSPWLMMIIAAARAYGLSALDGVYNNFKDDTGFKADCIKAAQMGFDGKTVIHPKQIDAANNAFGPSLDEIEKCKNIVAQFALLENKHKGVIQINGVMVERLHLDQAQQLLNLMKQLEN